MSKTITIKNEVYLELTKVKKKSESFSDLFDRLVKLATPLDALKGLRGRFVFRDKKGMLNEIYAKRAELR